MRHTKNIALVTALASKGFTSQKLANVTRLHPSTISQVLNCRVLPKRTTQHRIALALGARREELFADQFERGTES